MRPRAEAMQGDGADRAPTFSRHRSGERLLRVVRVLTYHAVGEGSSFLSVAEAQFEAQMRHVKETYRPVAFGQFLSYRAGRESFSKAPVLITFDDGLENICTRAFPILGDLGVPALIFLSTGVMGGRHSICGEEHRLMSWGQAEALRAGGLCAFGSHTRHHVRLAEAAPAAARDEIAGSKQDLADKLPADAMAFCYPQCCYGRETIDMVRAAGYACAFGGEGLTWRWTPRFQLRRIQVERSWGIEEFARRVARPAPALALLRADLLEQLKGAWWRVRRRPEDPKVALPEGR